jgi:hypothetical protein
MSRFVYCHKAQVRQNWYARIAALIETQLTDGAKTKAQLMSETGYSKRMVERGLAALRERQVVLTASMPRTATVYEMRKQ